MQTPPIEGLSRLSESWAPWAHSPLFFSRGLWRGHPDMAADDVAGFLAKWRTRYHAKDANDLLRHLAMWADHDVARGADLREAAVKATAPILFAPIASDAYFHPEDAAEQAACFPNARVVVVESPSGHAAAFGRQPEDVEQLTRLVASFLDEETNFAGDRP